MGRPVATSYKTSWRLQSPRAGRAEVERRLEQLVSAWVGKAKSGDDLYEDAFKNALKAFIETSAGKKLLEVLTKNKVLPLTLAALGAGLTGILSQGKDFPSPPDIPIGGGMKIKFELKGNVRNVQGVTIGFEMPLGTAKKAVATRIGQAKQIPGDVAQGIRRTVPDDVISAWAVKQAYWNWETAGPREEDALLKARRRVEESAKGYSARALAEGVTRGIMGARRNETDVRIHLGHDAFWKELTELKGLVTILQKIVGTVAKLLGTARTGNVKTVTFARLKKSGSAGLIPVRIP